MRFSSLISLRAEIGSGRTALGEVAGEDGVDKGAKDDLSTAIRRVSIPSMIERTL